ncbi:hypothetical protein FTO68_09850 [Methanocalculus taiwanensis]|uniref:Transposase n=1 Tax=Methanocalculus taiwanensis TaxID=106207 RepID=A0ABD4TLU9_9EURY|nr:hypothetical protein [Methanocalculus taiwanensis]MCQ1539282.1 hypothetical protein [Methanocalculus taiwanensis]
MKTLPFIRGKNDRITVECATGEVPIHTRCVHCIHCAGIRDAKRLVPNPYAQEFQKQRRGSSNEFELLTAQTMFNTIVAKPSADAIECADEKGEGFHPLWAR